MRKTIVYVLGWITDLFSAISLTSFILAGITSVGVTALPQYWWFGVPFKTIALDSLVVGIVCGMIGIVSDKYLEYLFEREREIERKVWDILRERKLILNNPNLSEDIKRIRKEVLKGGA